MHVTLRDASRGAHAAPRSKHRLEPSLLPFVLIACVGQLAALLTPTQLIVAPFVASTAILLVVLAALTIPAGPRGTVEPYLLLVAYVASVGLLIASEGFSTSGSGQLLLLPLIAAALYLTPGASIVSSAAVLATILTLSIPGDTGTTVRRLFTWLAVCVLVAVPIHALRRRLSASAAAEERRRIARDLHDGLAQELAFIATKARAVARDTGSEDVHSISNSADRALDEARRAIALLGAEQPQELRIGLVRIAEDVGARYDVRVDVDVAEHLGVDTNQSEQLLRIAREAISNAARHGRPHRIVVRVWSEVGLHLVIQDDGDGFDPSCEGHGFGFVSMRERAAALGGTLHVESAPHAGVRIEVLVP